MRCPVCKAETAQGPHCRRCRADLTLLFSLEDQRRHALEAARAYLARGELSHALTAAAQANAWRSDEDSRRLLALLHLLRHDFAQAWHGYTFLAEGLLRRDC